MLEALGRNPEAISEPILKVVGLYVGMPGVSQEQLTLDKNGIIEDTKHYGLNRIVNARSRIGYPKPPIGSEEPNWRMFSAITLEDLAVIQANYTTRYERHVGDVLPEWIGPNIVFVGMQNFSKIPDQSLLDFDNGPLLRVASENKSCVTPGKLIANELGLPTDLAKGFIKDANGFRGVVGTIDREGIIKPGMYARVIYPTINK
ncbi:MAG: hypothetical protein Q7K55_00980 [Candidatus Levybacteria bacterium]|nr:hypothetical protein [Candidatus Levybacteria bacterium]